MKRPTPREIDTRLREAKEALKNRRAFFANPAKVVGELLDLEIETEELWDLIIALIEEIELNDYSGGYPPQKSYEPLIADSELWAFSWDSSLLKKRMYLKFCVIERTFYYVSLHESKFSPRAREEIIYEVLEMQQ